MYLKQIQIHGFKTFAEKTHVVFNSGITCIVGPNGSGKSNIADAISWVLGENSVRALRGTTSQDVIFSGNDQRRPLGMAEVSLTIDNSRALLPLEFSEITVTRRVYRSGESDFLINKVACRLRDIYELFLDTGLGRDAYSMIGQGEIDQILSVRAEERRAIFEEAAGVKKYRVRKRETERRLEDTRQNLLRVADILTEIEMQLGPLQRQASAARRYRELAVQLREIEQAYYGQKLRRLGTECRALQTLVSGLTEERKSLELQLSAAQDAEKSIRDEVTKLDLQLERLRLTETAALQRVGAAEAEKARADERAGEIHRRLESIATDLAQLQQRIEDQNRRTEAAHRDEAMLADALESARAAVASTQSAGEAAARAREVALAELDQARTEAAQRAQRRASVEARLQAGREKLAAMEVDRRRTLAALEEAEGHAAQLAEDASHLARESEASSRAEQEAAVARLQSDEAVQRIARSLPGTREAERRTAAEAGRALARLTALRELDSEAAGFSEGARKLLRAVQAGELPGGWRPLLEWIEVPQGLERAVATALGDHAHALLGSEGADPRSALDWATAAAVAVMLLDECRGTRASMPGSLASQVVVRDSRAAAWAGHLLGAAFLLPELDAPLPSRAELGITPTGAWRSADGAYRTPDTADPVASAMLMRRREVERLELELPDLQAAAERAAETRSATESALRAAEASRAEARARLETARGQVEGQRREALRLDGERDRAERQLSRLRSESARLQEQAAALTESTAALAAELESLTGGDGPAVDEALAGAQTRFAGADRAWREAENALTECRVALSAEEQRHQAAVAASRRAVEGGSLLDRQREERLLEQRGLNAESEQRTISFTLIAGEAAEAEAAAVASRVAQAEIASSRSEREAALSATAAQARELYQRLREVMNRCQRAEVELASLTAQREMAGREWVDAAAGAHNLEAEQVVESDEAFSFTVEGLLQSWDQSAAEAVLSACVDPEAEIGRLRRAIRALGAINPDAVEQLAQASERFEFLTAQRDDLERAREQLLQVIHEVDAASRETFMRAFEEIAAAFDFMFKKLFGGGQTELRLTDPSDVLETGIDIIVQPPGKKQQNLLLLSGGERALTATAMLFALLKVRPSPFCVLDEVDAPLDEHNVGRFREVLQEFAQQTQFIVVTHNRGTMEGANTLYGVTMQERGVSKVLSCALDDPIIAQVEAERDAATVGG